jgi:hypothetical protein
MGKRWSVVERVGGETKSMAEEEGKNEDETRVQDKKKREAVRKGWRRRRLVVVMG